MLKTIILSFCTIIQIGSTYSIGINSIFRNDYTFSRKVKLFYKEHSTPQNWSDAVLTCKTEGAELINIESDAQALAILELLNEETEQIWLGIHDRYSDKLFITTEGKAVENVNLKWKPGEWNNTDNNGHCVSMDMDGLLNTVNCMFRLKFVCVKRMDQENNYNSECLTYDPEYNFSTELNACYKFHKEPTTWKKSYKICIDEQSKLAIINDEKEATLLVKLFEKRPAEKLQGNFRKDVLHVGFSDLLHGGIFVTIDGKYLSDAGYSRWAPDLVKAENVNSERCGGMFRNGELTDVDCETKAMFVCEKHSFDVENNNAVSVVDPK